MGEGLVVILFKSPRRGKVKTRLAAEVGEVVALDVYRRCLVSLFGTLRMLGSSFWGVYDPPGDKALIEESVGPFEGFAQSGGDLGARMRAAFERGFEHFDRVVLIGSDTPDLTACELLFALQSLVDHDAVVGPAEDGGYYLIGFRREGYDPAVFEAMPWSTSGVFEQTLERLTGKAVSILPVQRDIDTLADLRHYPQYNKEAK